MRLVHGSVLTLAIIAVGCASGGGTATAGGGNVADLSAGGSSFSQDVGLATITDFRTQANRILQRYQYEIERFDEGAYTSVDTYWKDRQLTADEAAAGYVAAQTRILLRTRLRSRVTTQTLAVHRVTFSAENQLRLVPGGDWEFGVMMEDFKDQMAAIAKQFETEFRAGVRR